MGSINYDDATIARAKSLYLKGIKAQRIANELNVGSKNTIAKWAADNDWEGERLKVIKEANSSVNEEFKDAMIKFKRSFVNFNLALFLDILEAYKLEREQNVPRDFETLKKNKITTEIIANLKFNITSIVDMDTDDTKKLIDKMQKALKPGNDEMKGLFVDGDGED